MVLFIGLSLAFVTNTEGQADRWLQGIKYKIDVDIDVETHKMDGKLYCQYYNNSPDTLEKVFFHLYFNAFQPGSMMDTRSLSILDPDRRVGDRISKLGLDEIGYHKINGLKCAGAEQDYHVEGTILEVNLSDPILPGSNVLFEMDFISQVPVQIRRSGRDNKEGISYSMSQWFPKMSEYDYQGWHANPYVGREFHGVWGDFDVKIRLDKKYIVGATGTMPDAKPKKVKGGKLEWRFKAENVHDFVWAADPDYKVFTSTADDGTLMEFYYQSSETTDANWEALPNAMNEALNYANKHFGKYPYPKYAFIQGGDGGMEYPMATLITGERSFPSLVGVSVHELMHSWYQMVLGTNESLYPWMDEGFTSFASAEIMNHLVNVGILSGEVQEDPHLNSVRGYGRFSQSGYEEPLSTHSDHYNTNQAYGVASYTKGTVFLKQLEYIMGKPAFAKGMLRYYDTWKFKHPNPNDFIRVMEKTSGLELDWFKEYFVNTTHTIDYTIDTIAAIGKNTQVELSKIGIMPMPLDVQVELNSGETINYYIPLRIMRGEKMSEVESHFVQSDWPWTHANYSFIVKHALADIKEIRIDPSERMADINLENNVWPKVEHEDEEN